MIDYTEINKTCSKTQEEVNLIKDVLAHQVSQGFDYNPFVVFYKDNDNRVLYVCPQNVPNASPEYTSVRIGEAMALFPALPAHCAFISLTAKCIKDDVEYNLLYIILASQWNAWSIQIPYLIQDSNVIWYDNLASLEEIDSKDFEGPLEELVLALFIYCNMNSSPYTAEEILSYLSTQEAAIGFSSDHELQYYDFSSVN